MKQKKNSLLCFPPVQKYAAQSEEVLNIVNHSRVCTAHAFPLFFSTVQLGHYNKTCCECAG